VISIGFGNYVVREKVTAIVSAESAPVRRAVQEARKQGTLIDGTQGRRTKSVIFLDNGRIVLSGLSQDTLARRLGIPDETTG
jgi:extracellular matrix regulatory protein A